MVGLFSLTAPLGIVIGICVSGSYDENSPASLLVSGFLNAASAGILIYMALVDLASPLLLHHDRQTTFTIQLLSRVSFISGSALMSLLAIWA